jgi:hypothetical protein
MSWFLCALGFCPLVICDERKECWLLLVVRQVCGSGFFCSFVAQPMCKLAAYRLLIHSTKVLLFLLAKAISIHSLTSRECVFFLINFKYFFYFYNLFISFFSPFFPFFFNFVMLFNLWSSKRWFSQTLAIRKYGFILFLKI